MNTTHRTEICNQESWCRQIRERLSVFKWSRLMRNNQQESREEEMTTILKPLRNRRQGGYVMISAMALTLVLLGVGIAFMQWASDESIQSQHNLAGMQAYYLAQTGVIEEGLHWLRTQQAGLLPQQATRRNDGEVIVDRKLIGKYKDVIIAPVFGGLESGDIFFSKRKFRISATGRVVLPWNEDGRNEEKEVLRKAILYVSVRSFADYMYLTDHEVTPLGEVVRFFNGDTLWWRVHSNDTIRMMQRPVFYGQVTTCASRFDLQAGASPQFLGPDPAFNVPRVNIPTVAATVREGAAAQSNIYNLAGQEYRLSMRGSSGILYYWEEGAPFDSLTAHHVTVPLNGTHTCIFVERPLSMHGVITGDWTIGCSEDIYLIDNITYTCLNWGDDFSIEPTCTDYCGIVSEKKVIIANTWANGRENQAQGSSIIICAAIVALGEDGGSFTFDQQNDVWDTYIGPNPDERGRIHLRGSVTQRFRGYVHRSNQGGTGYLKDYAYDDRFVLHRPPCFFDAVDQSGRALFDVVQWGQAVEEQQDIRNDIRVRYN